MEENIQKDYYYDLKKIVTYIETTADVNIGTRSRKRHLVELRGLYFKLALETTSYSYEKIGKIVDRDHASVLHSRKHLFDKIMLDHTILDMYHNYKVEVLNQQVTEHYKNQKQFNILKNKYNTLYSRYGSLKIRYNNVMKGLDDDLTDNEKGYRKLSRKNKYEYDRRVNLILKSFKWKEQNETGEIIIGSGSVNDARGTL
jgi:hypothetical protein